MTLTSRSFRVIIYNLENKPFYVQVFVFSETVMNNYMKLVVKLLWCNMQVTDANSDDLDPVPQGHGNST